MINVYDIIFLILSENQLLEKIFFKVQYSDQNTCDEFYERLQVRYFLPLNKWANPNDRSSLEHRQVEAGLSWSRLSHAGKLLTKTKMNWKADCLILHATELGYMTMIWTPL